MSDASAAPPSVDATVRFQRLEYGRTASTLHSPALINVACVIAPDGFAVGVVKEQTLGELFTNRRDAVLLADSGICVPIKNFPQNVTVSPSIEVNVAVDE